MEEKLNIRERARQSAENLVLDILLPRPSVHDSNYEKYEAVREKFEKKLRLGELDLREVEIDDPNDLTGDKKVRVRVDEALSIYVAQEHARLSKIADLIRSGQSIVDQDSWVKDPHPTERPFIISDPVISDKTQSRIPPQIQESLQRFREQHPDPQKAAFIIMQFGKTKAHRQIVEAIRKTLSRYGIYGLRADDKDYHDELFSNILTHMYGCGFGIAVFERIEEDSFNPNVSLEVGYMMAMTKPICILKDKTLKNLNTDLIGKLYKEFDSLEPHNTIPIELDKWLLDRAGDLNINP